MKCDAPRLHIWAWAGSFTVKVFIHKHEPENWETVSLELTAARSVRGHVLTRQDREPLSL